MIGLSISELQWCSHGLVWNNSSWSWCSNPPMRGKQSTAVGPLLAFFPSSNTGFASLSKQWSHSGERQIQTEEDPLPLLTSFPHSSSLGKGRKHRPLPTHILSPTLSWYTPWVRQHLTAVRHEIFALFLVRIWFHRRQQVSSVMYTNTLSEQSLTHRVRKDGHFSNFSKLW